MHDLIRLYAEQRAEVEPQAESAWLRLAEWYLATTDAATRFAYLPAVRLTPQVGPQVFSHPDEAQAWLEQEEACLVAVVRRASERGPAAVAWQLADVLRRYLTVHHRVDAWRATVVGGMTAARASDDLGGQGAMLHSLGALQFISGDNAAAIGLASQAAELYAKAGFGLGYSALMCNLGMAYDDLAAALAAADEAVAIAPDLRSRTVALFDRGAAHRLLGNLEQAEADLSEAAQSGDESLPQQYEAATLYADLGYLEEAESWARKALTRSHGNGQPWHEAAALNVLGRICNRRGHWNDAARYHQAAGGIARSNGHRATVAESVLGLAEADLGRGQPQRAAELAKQTLLSAHQLGHRILACRALLLLAVLEPAAGHAAAATAIQEETGFVPSVPSAG